MDYVARAVTSPVQRSFGFIDVGVARNACGRQLDSFEATSDDGALALVFILAPRVTDVGAGVEVLATHRSEPVLVRQGQVIAAAFQRELAQDQQVHRSTFGTS